MRSSFIISPTLDDDSTKKTNKVLYNASLMQKNTFLLRDYLKALRTSSPIPPTVKQEKSTHIIKESTNSHKRYGSITNSESTPCLLPHVTLYTEVR